MGTRIAIAPTGSTSSSRGDKGAQQLFDKAHEAVVAGGGTVVALGDAEGLVWLDAGGAGLADALDAAPAVRWVQLPWAGVENIAATGAFRRAGITFTCAKSSFAGQVGEHAIMLTMAALRHVTEQARTRIWYQTEPESLEGKRVTILGAGGITGRMLPFLRVAGCHVTVVRRSADSVEGADRTVATADLDTVLPDTDVLALALALTPETTGIIDADRLALLPRHAVVVNVARGRHIDTDALVDALRHNRIRAAALDVTEPQPLPDGHPLWSMDNVLITSHSADSLAYVRERLAERITGNVRAFAEGRPLQGVVDPESGY